MIVFFGGIERIYLSSPPLPFFFSHNSPLRYRCGSPLSDILSNIMVDPQMADEISCEGQLNLYEFKPYLDRHDLRQNYLYFFPTYLFRNKNFHFLVQSEFNWYYWNSCGIKFNFDMSVFPTDQIVAEIWPIKVHAWIHYMQKNSTTVMSQLL